MSSPTITVQRKNERFQTRLDWLESYHSFSFGPHHVALGRGHDAAISIRQKGAEILVWEMNRP